jgi:hypothetical protein
MIYKSVIHDRDQDAPGPDAIAVARIDNEVYINTGKFSEKIDGSFKFKANGPQVKVDINDLLHAVGFEWTGDM